MGAAMAYLVGDWLSWEFYEIVYLFFFPILEL